MPELPEVHTISKDLEKNIVGLTLVDVIPVDNYKIQGDFTSLISSKVTSVARIAKNIVIESDSGKYLVIHLAMTGRLILGNNKEKWTRVVFKLADEAKTIVLTFSDMRMFGKVGVVEQETLNQLSDRYGPEPIEEGLTSAKFLESIKSKKTTIKNALLDQTIIAGLGNIYATDALFLAKIHPETLTSVLSTEDAQKLLTASKNVLQEGIATRGSTLPDKMYVDLFGKEGSYQHFFKIYMKAICPNCKTKVTFKKINGRGTYFCLNCQPLKTEAIAQKSLL